ncbi:MAG TPA: DUF2059 domain-containing protein [Terriglobales bacterium]|nr:DUF2059 domain-containing protein [Terriglobales bacterium]
MKRLLLVATVVFSLSWSCLAQANAEDSPASKADVERYFQIVRSHDMMKKMMGTMTQSIHQMMHEQYLKHQEDLPADYESKMSAMTDDMFLNMPMDEMMQAMVPAYQKHLTKGDIDNLVAFYSSPTGEKVLREMPAMMAEAMQDMMPIMSKYMDTVRARLQKETDTMLAQSKKQPNTSAPATNN